MEYKYKIGQEVYLKTDPEQFKRIVSGILIRKGHVVFYLICGVEETAHYDYEITTERVLMFAIN